MSRNARSKSRRIPERRAPRHPLSYSTDLAVETAIGAGDWDVVHSLLLDGARRPMQEAVMSAMLLAVNDAPVSLMIALERRAGRECLRPAVMDLATEHGSASLVQYLHSRGVERSAIGAAPKLFSRR